MNDQDRALKDLLGPSNRSADLQFTSRVGAQIALEQRLAKARRVAWRRFAVDACAHAGMIVALLVLAAQPVNEIGMSLEPAMSPATLLLFIFAVWAIPALRRSEGQAAA